MYSSRYYYFEGEEVVRSCSLPYPVTKLGGMHLFDNLNETDVVLLSSEAEELETAARTVLEATSWMDW